MPRTLRLTREQLTALAPADLAGVAGADRPIHTGDWRDCLKTLHPALDELLLASQSRSCEGS